MNEVGQANPEPGESPVAAGRSCGSCMLCCKVLSVAALGKGPGTWCRHAKSGVGCTIYAERPGECRRFLCGYLAWPELPEIWRPTRARMVLRLELEGSRIAVHVDPGHPEAWRAEPYYATLKVWAEAARRRDGQVVVFIGRRAIVILPDRDVDLGRLGDDELIVTGERETAAGPVLEASIVKQVRMPRLAEPTG